ncbi:cellulose-binding domain-containing protein [Lentzea sp.]|uniref:cellulose-binding domain-containing protein n=1 Tax=Lentzea sp. TaxID=56099 RepID=UPI002ED30581
MPTSAGLRRPLRAASGLLAALVLLTCACTAEPATQPVPPPTRVPLKPPTLVNQGVRWQGALHFVRDVLDGRTVELADGTRVRVAGLVTPTGCAAEGALAFARSTLLASAVRVTTSTPGEVELTLEDGTDYALLAVRSGALRAEDGPLLSVEAEAAAADRGMWGPPCDGSNATPSSTAAQRTTTAKVVPLPVPVTTTAPARTTTPPVARACAVSYRVTGEWPGGFQANVVVRNTGFTAVNGWTARWTFAGGQTVRDMWNATPRQSGAAVTAVNADYNPQIQPGASVLIGFNGTLRGPNPVPGAFTLNGRSCSVE